MTDDNRLDKLFSELIRERDYLRGQNALLAANRDPHLVRTVELLTERAKELERERDAALNNAEEADVACTNELHGREAVEDEADSMRPVVEAACAWNSGGAHTVAEEDALSAAVDAYRQAAPDPASAPYLEGAMSYRQTAPDWRAKTADYDPPGDAYTAGDAAGLRRREEMGPAPEAGGLREAAEEAARYLEETAHHSCASMIARLRAALAADKPVVTTAAATIGAAVIAAWDADELWDDGSVVTIQGDCAATIRAALAADRGE